MDSDLENEDDEILNITGLPEEIAGEAEAFNIRNDEIETVTSDDEDNDVETQRKRQTKYSATRRYCCI